MEIEPVAYVQNAYTAKFGIPHQSGRVESVISKIVFEGAYRNDEALRGIGGYSHLWLIWGFSETQGRWSPTVRPPRLGGNTREGVFATRSPFRPNGLGLSSVSLLEVRKEEGHGTVLLVGGADLMNGTPVYDIKPYIPSDCHTGGHYGFTEQIRKERLRVHIPEKLCEGLPAQMPDMLRDVLAEDPRPGYQKSPERIYGMAFGGYEVRFRVEGDDAEVLEIYRENAPGESL